MSSGYSYLIKAVTPRGHFPAGDIGAHACAPLSGRLRRCTLRTYGSSVHLPRLVRWPRGFTPSSARLRRKLPASKSASFLMALLHGFLDRLHLWSKQRIPLYLANIFCTIGASKRHPQPSSKRNHIWILNNSYMNERSSIYEFTKNHIWMNYQHFEQNLALLATKLSRTAAKTYQHQPPRRRQHGFVRVSFQQCDITRKLATAVRGRRGLSSPRRRARVSPARAQEKRRRPCAAHSPRGP